jgi:hypothetical protein
MEEEGKNREEEGWEIVILCLFIDKYVLHIIFFQN